MKIDPKAIPNHPKTKKWNHENSNSLWTFVFAIHFMPKSFEKETWKPVWQDTILFLHNPTDSRNRNPESDQKSGKKRSLEPKVSFFVPEPHDRPKVRWDAKVEAPGLLNNSLGYQNWNISTKKMGIGSLREVSNGEGPVEEGVTHKTTQAALSESGKHKP